MPTSGSEVQCLKVPAPPTGWNWAFKETKNMTPMLEILLACLVPASLSMELARLLEHISRDADQILSAALNSSS